MLVSIKIATKAASTTFIFTLINTYLFTGVSLKYLPVFKSASLSAFLFIDSFIHCLNKHSVPAMCSICAE